MNKYFIAISPFLIVIVHKILTLLNVKSVCVWYLLTGHKCIGCGITKAVVYMLHGQFKLAYEANPLVFIVFPLLLYCWLNYIKREFFKK